MTILKVEMGPETGNDSTVYTKLNTVVWSASMCAVFSVLCPPQRFMKLSIFNLLYEALLLYNFVKSESSANQKYIPSLFTIRAIESDIFSAMQRSCLSACFSDLRFSHEATSHLLSVSDACFSNSI